MRSRCVGGGPGTEAASRAPPASLPSPSAGYLLSSLLIGPPLAVGGGLALPGRAGQPVFFWANPRRPLSVGSPTQGDAESSGWLLRPPVGHYGHVGHLAVHLAPSGTHGTASCCDRGRCSPARTRGHECNGS